MSTRSRIHLKDGIAYCCDIAFYFLYEMEVIVLLGLVVFIILIIAVALGMNSKTDPGAVAADYTNQYLNNPILEKLFNDIEQSFLQQINEIPMLEKQGKYRRLFEGGRYPRKLRFEVDVSDHYISVHICYPYLDYISFVNISVYLKLYNISFAEGDPEMNNKQAGLAIAVFKRIINLLPNTITTGSFDIIKEDDSYTMSSHSHVMKELTAYNTVKDTTYLL